MVKTEPNQLLLLTCWYCNYGYGLMVAWDDIYVKNLKHMCINY